MILKVSLIVLAITFTVVFGYLFYASYYIGSNVYVNALCRCKVKKNFVALTFDDGVDAEQTPKVLDILHAYGVHATFFLIGKQAEKYPDIVRRIVEEGHTIGIHTYSHQNTFPFGSTEKITEDLRQTQQILQQITGCYVSLFRPPFGVTNPHIAKAVKKLKLKTIGWTIRSYDTNMRTPREQVVNRIKHQLKPGAIILLHDNRPQSDVLLEQILQMLIKSDYRVFPLR